MKNIVKNNILGSIKRLGLVTTLLTIGLLSINAQDAGWVSQNIQYGFQRIISDGTWEHGWACGEDGTTSCGVSSVSPKELGVLERVSLDLCRVTTWKGNNGNVCAAKMKWSVNGKTWTEVTDLSAQYIGGNDTKWEKSGISTVFASYTDAATGPGNYSFQYLYSTKMNGYGTSCPDNYTANLDNGGKNYKLNFTIPGFKGNSTLDFGEVNKEEASKEMKYNYNYFGYDNCSVKITGSDHSNFKCGLPIESSNEGELTVIFTPTAESYRTYNATLTLSGEVNGEEYTKNIALTGKYVQYHAVTVLIADTAHVSDGPIVTLQGYLKYASCRGDINTYGFYYIEADDKQCSDVTTAATKKSKTVTTPLDPGSVFSCTITSGLKENKTYLYKAFVQDSEDHVTLSAECGTFTTGGSCTFSRGDTIYYTINSSLDEDNPCSLEFRSITSAFNNMVTHNDITSDNYWWNSTTKMLQKNIVFLVAEGTYGTAGDAIDFKNINSYDLAPTTAPTKAFVMRPLNSNGDKPVVYGMDLNFSRWVTIQGMKIVRDNNGQSAISIGLTDSDNNGAVGAIADARIKFIDCDIEGENFCSIQVQGIDGLYMENCNLTATINGAGSMSVNTFNWGSSIKFMNCKNIKLVRNNFKGSHSQNIFAQGVQNMLLMNNVFWNDNVAKRPTPSASQEVNYLAFIRLIHFVPDSPTETAHKIKNIGMYYNTFYLANDEADNSRVNFLTLGGVGTGSGPAQYKKAENYDFNTIDFMYNNCYSYDTDTPGRTEDAFCSTDISSSAHITKNNFWSKKADDTNPSGFAFGSNTYNINVSEQVCSTAPHNPEGLVIRGGLLNLGQSVTTDVSEQGAQAINADRNEYNIRPVNWTLGAYQQKVSGNRVQTLVWTGNEDYEWDNRNNWTKEDGTMLDCVDIISEDLKVVIPELASGKAYPKFPSTWSNPEGEEVRAGLGIQDIEVSKYASEIVVENGAAILGVEYLNEGDKGSDVTRRYVKASTSLKVYRQTEAGTAEEWVLVGTVVKPFKNGSTTEVRPVCSGDYYIANQEPHVYMQHVKVDGSSIVPGTTFTSLEQVVDLQSAYMIKVPDQYGYYKIPASQYYKRYVPDASKLGDGTVPKSFTFTGWYAASEEGLPTFNITTDGEYNFVNNYYPANLNVSQFISDNKDLNAKYYDYKSQSWTDVQNNQNTEIKPQNGFVLYTESSSLSTVTPAATCYTNGSTKYRNALAARIVQLSVENVNDHTASTIFIKTETNNLPKAFGSNPTTPEVYVPDGKAMYSTFKVSDTEDVVPLTVRSISTKPIAIKFRLDSHNGFDEVILEDRKSGTEYDLTEVSPIFNYVTTGEITNRFFLNVSTGVIPTEVPEDRSSSDVESQIIISTKDNVITISASTDQSMQMIYVTDMAGRTDHFAPKGSNYSQHKLPVANGVYIVRVVTDKTEYQQKVIIK